MRFRDSWFMQGPAGRFQAESSSLGILDARPELLLFMLVLAACNATLLVGVAPLGLILHSGRVMAGEWWRVLTHPWTHVSLYHLFLDGAAFLILYATLREQSLYRRLAYLVATATGALLAALWQNSDTHVLGLCGLSGVGHGLLAVSCLETMSCRHQDRALGIAGAIGLVAVSGKVAWEALSGRVLFGGMHVGDVGMPIAVCHAGGVLGGVVLFVVNSLRSNFPRRRGGQSMRSNSSLVT